MNTGAAGGGMAVAVGNAVGAGLGVNVADGRVGMAVAASVGNALGFGVAVLPSLWEGVGVGVNASVGAARVGSGVKLATGVGSGVLDGAMVGAMVALGAIASCAGSAGRVGAAVFGAETLAALQPHKASPATKTDAINLFRMAYSLTKTNNQNYLLTTFIPAQFPSLFFIISQTIFHLTAPSVVVMRTVDIEASPFIAADFMSPSGMFMLNFLSAMTEHAAASSRTDAAEDAEDDFLVSFVRVINNPHTPTRTISPTRYKIGGVFSFGFSAFFMGRAAA